MKRFEFSSPELVQLIKEGAVGILPTDTIYGIHGSAFSKKAIDRMYEVRLRDETKPFLILIPDIESLSQFGITLSETQMRVVEELSRHPISIVLPVTDPQFEYLTRGTNSIGFRIPSYRDLKALLRLTGPLASTSVNKQGEKPCETIEEAERVFNNVLDYGVDVGKKSGTPSTIVKLHGNKIEVVRQGATIIPIDLIK